MNFASQLATDLVLWLSPLVQAGAVMGLVWFIATVRRNFGARNMQKGALAAFGAGLLALHTGYFLAPMWWKTGQYLLGAATMLPIALLSLTGIVITLSQTGIVQGVSEAAVHRRVALYGGMAALVLAYVGPLVLMLVASV